EPTGDQKETKKWTKGRPKRKPKAAHAATASIDVQNALKGMPIPVHPGAQKYYDEVGVKAE
ncbi:MAG: TAXI family TRAP transporter solute-binding subunit, partial [Paracoccus sp. (in: a-proteobacteria)]